MKIKAMDLIKHIDRASMGGLINEAVFSDGMLFALTDESRSIVSICSNGIADDVTGEIGIFNLKLFINAVKYAQKNIFTDGQDIQMDIADNMLIFGNGKDKFTFPIGSPDRISTTVDNAQEVIEKIIEGEATTVTLTPSVIGKCQKVIKMICPAKCVFIVEPGSITLLVGDEKEYNATVDLGATKGKSTFKLVVKPNFLSKVLDVLPKDKDTTLEIRAALPLIFKINYYIFILASMEVDQ